MPHVAILLLIYGATIVMNIDNFLRPRLVSGRSNVHPVLILIGVLGGLRVFGFIGMLVGPLDPGDPCGADQVLRTELHAAETTAEVSFSRSLTLLQAATSGAESLLDPLGEDRVERNIQPAGMRQL